MPQAVLDSSNMPACTAHGAHKTYRPHTQCACSSAAPVACASCLTRRVRPGAQTAQLEALVDAAAAGIDRHVINVLLSKHRFVAHCDAIKRYLLLGQARP